MLKRSGSRGRHPQRPGEDEPEGHSGDEPDSPARAAGQDEGGQLIQLTKQRRQPVTTAMLTPIALTTHAQQVTVSGLQVTVEYPPQLTQLTRDDKAAHLQSAYSLFGEPVADVGTTLVNGLDDDQCLWLMGALAIHTVNLAGLQSAGVHLPALRQRLVRRARQVRRAPWGSDRYVTDVVRCGGWAAPWLIGRLRVPKDEQVLVELRALFNPVAKAEALIPLIDPGPVQQQATTTTTTVREGFAQRLEGALLPPLKRVIHEQAGKWLTPQQREIPWEEVQRIADLVQNFVFNRMGDYPAANADSPLYEPVAYADILVSTTEASTDDEAVIGMLSNRADLIGRGEQYGKPYDVAGYEPGDADTLAAIIRGLLADQELVKATRLLLQRTGKHSHAQGRIFVCPIVVAGRSITQQRWNLTVTLFHELMHRLTHPDFQRAAAYVEHDQLLIEGFTELIAVHMFTAFVELVRSQPRVCAVVLGADVPYEEPEDRVSGIGYGAAGAGAVRMAELLGMDNLLAAYFLGAVHLIGMRKV